jgi:hypothetical protein
MNVVATYVTTPSAKTPAVQIFLRRNVQHVHQAGYPV